MSFVDGDEGGLAAGEHGGEVWDTHALGRDEEELEGAVEVVATGLAGLVAGEAGVYAGDAEAEGGMQRRIPRRLEPAIRRPEIRQQCREEDDRTGSRKGEDSQRARLECRREWPLVVPQRASP